MVVGLERERGKGREDRQRSIERKENRERGGGDEREKGRQKRDKQAERG